MAENLSLQNFDWDAYENEKGGKQNEEILSKYDATVSSIKPNEVVDGVVKRITKREVVVNIGYKSDGVVPASEFRYNPDLKVGDKVEVYINSLEDGNGQLVLSHKDARANRSWERINQAFDNNEVITGFIKCRTKGGMIVDIFGTESFLPGSQIDVKPIRDYDVFVGKTMEFKIVKINQDFRNVVVSHKALIEAELEAQKREIVSKLEKGQILEGVVKNITNYGVFIDLGGVDGLIHITDLSWGRVNDPHDIVQLEQKINVVIIDFDEEKQRIALGLKQLTPHPWDALPADLKVGDKIHGKVVVIADYGAFVEVAPGIEGLVHVSEISWSQHLRSASDFLKVGDEVDTVILSIDRDERKMSLGIKQLKPDPWENIEVKYAIGTRHFAKVRNFTNFGVFVELEEGVDGLIHISDLSWVKKIKHPNEFTSIGAEMEVVVLEIDKESRRLSLGHKQLEENPWEELEIKYGVDSIVDGKIIELTDKGAVVLLEGGIEGFCASKYLQKEDKSKVKLDETLPFKVIEFNRDSKRIILSHLNAWQTQNDNVAHNEMSKRKLEKTTLGDIAALSELKEAVAKEAKNSNLKKTAANEAKNSDLKETAADETGNPDLKETVADETGNSTEGVEN